MKRSTIPNFPFEKSICFIPDIPGWAFDRSTKNFIKHLNLWDVSANRYFVESLPEVINEHFIYVCWWADTERIRQKITTKQKLICRIADMHTWNSNAPIEWQDKFWKTVPHIFLFIASSEEICNCLKSVGINNVVVVGDGVDIDEFPEKQYRKNHLPIAGWCGNPNALKWIGLNDVKGLSILQHLKEINNIMFVTISNHPSNKMAEWYSSIDIYLCCSRSEGTPLPVLEAMAVGCIIISTNVGVVKEIESQGVFLFDGTYYGLINKISEVINRRKEWELLGQANRRYIMNNRSSGISAMQLYSALFD